MPFCCTKAFSSSLRKRTPTDRTILLPISIIPSKPDQFTRAGLVLLGLSGLLYLVTRFLPEDRLRAALVCAAVSLIVLLTFSAGAFFLRISAGVRVLLVTAAWLMTFDLYLGFTYERYDIIGARSSRVLFESEKD